MPFEVKQPEYNQETEKSNAGNKILYDGKTSAKVYPSAHKVAKRYRDHPLTGEYSGFRESHVLPDWLLVYAVDHERSVLSISRTGTHSDLF